MSVLHNSLSFGLPNNENTNITPISISIFTIISSIFSTRLKKLGYIEFEYKKHVLKLCKDLFNLY